MFFTTFYCSYMDIGYITQTEHRDMKSASNLYRMCRTNTNLSFVPRFCLVAYVKMRLDVYGT